MRHSHFLINITFDFWHLHCIQYAHPLQSAVGAKRIFTSTSKTVHLPAPGHIVLQHHAIWCGANEWGAKSHCIAQARGPCPCMIQVWTSPYSQIKYWICVYYNIAASSFTKHTVLYPQGCAARGTYNLMLGTHKVFFSFNHLMLVWKSPRYCIPTAARAHWSVLMTECWSDAVFPACSFHRSQSWDKELCPWAWKLENSHQIPTEQLNRFIYIKSLTDNILG